MSLGVLVGDLFASAEVGDLSASAGGRDKGGMARFNRGHLVVGDIALALLHYGFPKTTDCALHQGRVRSHFNLLRLRPDFEVNADGRSLVDIQ